MQIHSQMMRSENPNNDGSSTFFNFHPQKTDKSNLFPYLSNLNKTHYQHSFSFDKSGNMTEEELDFEQKYQQFKLLMDKMMNAAINNQAPPNLENEVTSFITNLGATAVGAAGAYFTGNPAALLPAIGSAFSVIGQASSWIYRTAKLLFSHDDSEVRQRKQKVEDLKSEVISKMAGSFRSFVLTKMLLDEIQYRKNNNASSSATIKSVYDYLTGKYGVFPTYVSHDFYKARLDELLPLKLDNAEALDAILDLEKIAASEYSDLAMQAQQKLNESISADPETDEDTTYSDMDLTNEKKRTLDSKFESQPKRIRI